MSSSPLSSRTADSTPLLQVRDLHAGYGRAEVLHGLSLQAEPGSVVTVIGPNGAGKSTLLGALMGVLPSRGELLYQGQSIAGLTLEQRVERGIALVPETRALFGSMSIEDNLRLGSYRLRGALWAPRAIGADLDEVYGLFPRLLERRRQTAGTLSGGERQMLAIGRALMGKPSLLMLDEPSLGLAPLIVREIFAIIDRLRATGVTILLVEQNARAALEVADHGYVLETGDIALHGPARQLAGDPRVIDTYLGAMAQA
ncbi:amino acid/amide ABC transporter ATP-binding protein 2 (HAAT family) [Comamonas sp. BIGb0124]|uniref:ABC transporter ATP-binding protein n=1 Tax=Comamonas sp. BIGb0124 TaxID=2485130 RepID=UPI000F497533|nr:ABC transporter ATP-binding protein [Comamonas sp. BIGb0124]ROR17100.1 amino acid/amide ABC transporter ATP-binding protein 2 (HAAT family) [Comamonas sp. BIGb0124]